MTSDDQMTCTDTRDRDKAVSPPAPRCWPHIARKQRPAEPRAERETQRPAPWPRRPPAPVAPVSAGHDERGRLPYPSGGRYRPGTSTPVARPVRGPRIAGRGWCAETARGAGAVRPAGAGAWSAGDRDLRAAASGSPEQPAAGPSDIERRARRYDRRMAYGSGRFAQHTEPCPALGASGSQHRNPERTTRYPTVRPGGTDLPAPATPPFAPGRRSRRSTVRNPIRRTNPDDRTDDRERSIRYRASNWLRSATPGARRYVNQGLEAGKAGAPALRAIHRSRHHPARAEGPKTSRRSTGHPVPATDGVPRRSTKHRSTSAKVQTLRQPNHRSAWWTRNHAFRQSTRIPTAPAPAAHRTESALSHHAGPIADQSNPPAPTVGGHKRGNTCPRRRGAAEAGPTLPPTGEVRERPAGRRGAVGSAAARHRRRLPQPRRRTGALLGAALTTVIVAFPLGPGSTVAAYSGEHSVAAQAASGVVFGGRGPADSPGSATPWPLPRVIATAGDSGTSHREAVATPPLGLPAPAARSGSEHRPQATQPAGHDEAEFESVAVAAGLESARGGVVLRSADSAVHAPAGSHSVPLSLSGPGSARQPLPGTASTEGSPLGSASGSKGDSGSAGAPGSAAAAVPLAGAILRALIRLAPLVGPPPCPCPRDRQ